MRVPFKAIGASVVALSLAICGCRDKKSESSGGSKSESGSGSPTRAAFKPMVGEDVKYALGVNLDKDQAFKVVDACIAELVKVLKDEMANSPDFDEENGSELREMVAEIREQVADCKEDPFKNAPEALRALLDESGLRNPEIYWGVLALEDFKVMDNQPQFKGLSLSIAGKVDLDKLISALQREFGADLDFEKTMLEGERTWHVVSSDSSVAWELRRSQIDLYVTSLDGELLLVAGSRETLVKQILLYRKGEGKGDLLHGFSAADGEFAHLHLSGVGDMLWQYVPPGILRDLASELKNGKRILWGLKDFVFDVKARSDGSLWGSVQLGTASSTDTDQLRTFAKNMLPLAAKAPNVPACVKKMIEEMEIGGEMDGLEISNVNLFSLTLGAFMPVVSSAMLTSKTSEMAANGRKLHSAIIMANVNRENAGKGTTAWPRTASDEGGNTADNEEQDIGDRSFTSATDYFNALFDMKHYGETTRNPEVEDLDLGVLSGAGVPGHSGGRSLDSRSIAWNIAANVTDGMPDFMPVLISANFNPALLLNKWDGQTDGKRLLPIGPKSGAEKSMFGDQAIVVVRFDGAAEVIKEKYLTYDVLYKKNPFDLSDKAPPLKYLTPTGVVEPVGHR